MSHRSRLCAAYIDVPRDDYEASVRFYGELLGRVGETDDNDPDYTSYGDGGANTPAPGIDLGVQAVGDPRPRVHLDLETDDIDAEVGRLIALGATEVARIQTWVVMRDPVGTVFCIVGIQNPDTFAAHATIWD